MANNRIRTYPFKGLTIFLSIVTVLSAGGMVLVYFIEDVIALKIFFMIILAIFFIGGLIVLSDQLFNYVEVKDNVLIKHALFVKKEIKFEKLFRVRVIEDFYVVQVENEGRFTKFATTAPNAENVIVYMERHGIKVDWGNNSR